MQCSAYSSTQLTVWDEEEQKKRVARWRRMWYIAYSSLGRTVCDAIIINGEVWKPSEMCKTFAMTDASNTVQVLVACVMKGIRFSSINHFRWGGTKEMGSQMKVCAMYSIRFTRMNYLWLGNTMETVSQIKGVCDIRHAVHSDELFVIRQHKRNGQPDEGVCDIRHAVHSDELFALRHENRNSST